MRRVLTGCAVSTDPPLDPAAFDARRAYRRSPHVTVRSEPFGGLAYDFASRRLTYLASPDVVAVVEALERHDCAAAAIAAAGVSSPTHHALERSLAVLLARGVIHAR